ncbi:hypothetical protein [Schaalia vaccimaxillae]|uniref:hypothetical protein n=1 Tax=Schaalia vaccimaxillae TaxID=183916 RepID=UPI0003B68066|nr:hypothetical protein [Schaalia vaccimaxillae]
MESRRRATRLFLSSQRYAPDGSERRVGNLIVSSLIIPILLACYAAVGITLSDGWPRLFKTFGSTSQDVPGVLATLALGLASLAVALVVIQPKEWKDLRQEGASIFAIEMEEKRADYISGALTLLSQMAAGIAAVSVVYAAESRQAIDVVVVPVMIGMWVIIALMPTFVRRSGAGSLVAYTGYIRDLATFLRGIGTDSDIDDGFLATARPRRPRWWRGTATGWAIMVISLGCVAMGAMAHDAHPVRAALYTVALIWIITALAFYSTIQLRLGDKIMSCFSLIVVVCIDIFIFVEAAVATLNMHGPAKWGRIGFYALCCFSALLLHLLIRRWWMMRREEFTGLSSFLLETLCARAQGATQSILDAALVVDGSQDDAVREATILLDRIDEELIRSAPERYVDATRTAIGLARRPQTQTAGNGQPPLD